MGSGLRGTTCLRYSIKNNIVDDTNKYVNKNKNDEVKCVSHNALKEKIDE